MKSENKNGCMWYDIDGQPIQAHAGMILHYEDMYYWYGQNMTGETALRETGLHRVDFVGFSCYSSPDCVHWKNEGLVLSACDEPGHPLHPDRVGERPKVLYNEKTGKFVLWFHLDNHDYLAAHAGVAVADNPTGPFRFVREIAPNGYDCRDMTAFLDKDGKAYLIYSSDWNRTLRIAQLTDDFLDVNGAFSHAFPDQEREAPALFEKDGVYYMITSGCTGWEPNNALFGVSKNIFSGWKLVGDPCTGENARQTYFGQSTYIFEKDGAHYLMLDHWKPSDLQVSGYSILPIQVEDRHITIAFQDYTDL